jgi:hypothetical protein
MPFKADPVLVEIDPLPPQEVRDALVAVLEDELASEVPQDAWWRAGVAESVEGDAPGESNRI